MMACALKFATEHHERRQDVVRSGVLEGARLGMWTKKARSILGVKHTPAEQEKRESVAATLKEHHKRRPSKPESSCSSPSPPQHRRSSLSKLVKSIAGPTQTARPSGKRGSRRSSLSGFLGLARPQAPAAGPGTTQRRSSVSSFFGGKAGSSAKKDASSSSSGDKRRGSLSAVFKKGVAPGRRASLAQRLGLTAPETVPVSKKRKESKRKGSLIGMLAGLGVVGRDDAAATARAADDADPLGELARRRAREQAKADPLGAMVEIPRGEPSLRDPRSDRRGAAAATCRNQNFDRMFRTGLVPAQAAMREGRRNRAPAKRRRGSMFGDAPPPNSDGATVAHTMSNGVVVAVADAG